MRRHTGSGPTVTAAPVVVNCPQCPGGHASALGQSTCQVLYQCETCGHIFAVPLEPHR